VRRDVAVHAARLLALAGRWDHVPSELGFIDDGRVLSPHFVEQVIVQIIHRGLDLRSFLLLGFSFGLRGLSCWRRTA
jgi:hypothetical protein